MGGEGFGGGDTDFGACVHVNAAVAFAGEGACDVIADSEGAVAFAAAFAEGAEGVGGFAALADDEDEGAAGGREVSVAEFAGEFAFDGEAGEAFDDVFAGHGGVVGRAATAEDNPFDGEEFVVGHFEAAEFCGGVFVGKATAHGVADGVGLLVDFFEHEVGEGAFVGVVWGEFDGADLEFGVVAAEGGDLKVVGGEGDDIEVVQVNDFAGVVDEGGDVAGEEVAIFIYADDEWATFAGADDEVRDFAVDEGDAVGA